MCVCVRVSTVRVRFLPLTYKSQDKLRFVWWQFFVWNTRTVTLLVEESKGTLDRSRLDCHPRIIVSQRNFLSQDNNKKKIKVR